MLTEDQIEAMARANWPGIEWDDESLAESAHLREAFRAGVRAVIAANEAKAEPFGYFRAEPMGWTDCAATDEGAIALYERPAAPAVPEIDYQALIRASYATNNKWAQGTNGCSAFARGAEWFRAQMLAATPTAPSQERCCTCGYLTSEREHLGCLRKAVKDLDAATGGPYPSQEPVNRPQNCGTSFCSCIECVCEPEPVTLTDERLREIDDAHNWQTTEGRMAAYRAIIAALREKEQAT